MRNQMTDDIREALRHKADEVQPASIADLALAKAKRIRTRRWAAAGAGLLAAVLAVTIGVPQLVGRVSQPAVDLPSTAGPPGKKAQVGKGWYVQAGPAAGGAQVWNESTGNYVLYPARSVWPAPVTNWLAVVKNSDQSADKSFSIVFPAPKPPYELLRGQALIGAPQWNADGSKVLYGVDLGSSGSVEYRIADVSAQTVVKLHLGCDPRCQLVWLPDETKVAHRTETGMTVFVALTGAPGGTLSYWAGSRHSWSPDGSLAVGSKDGQPALIETATGQVRCSLVDKAPPSALVYWREDTEFMALGEELGYFTSDCEQKFSTTLPLDWAVAEPAQFTFAKEG